ncbi:MAG: DUF2259 domain-containing protein [Candidatus Cloacimonetes bacterium]|nr:DUF2259 domain-containing protein [Candidatus Cloacimonadota bacterium]MBS3767806.1 DUF2259 domain-containing protein [Candidatus Cloacimonadota bacterium]
MKKLLYIIILLVVFTKYLHCADTSDYSILGFSEDGRYVGLKISGVADGSGFPYIKISVYDCEKQTLAEEPFFNIIEITEEEDFEKGVTLAWDRSYENIEKIRQRYKLNTTNKGINVVKKGEYAPNLTSVGLKMAPWEVMLKLEEIVGEKTYYQMYTPSGLRIIFEYDSIKKVLKEEKPATEMENFRFDYSIQEVICFKNTFVLIISYKSPGFEGFNKRQMLVGDIIDPSN